MSDKPGDLDQVSIDLPGGSAHFPVLPATDGTLERRRLDIHQADRPDHLRPGLRQHRRDAQLHHLHRRRRRHPAVPRLRHRRPRHELDLPRGRLAADLRRAAVGIRARGVRREGPAPHAPARGPQAVLLGAAAHRASDVGAVERGVGAVDLLRGLARPAQPRDGRAVDHPAAGQAAGDRGVRAQEGARAGVPLPGQLAQLRRELPQAQLRQPRRDLRGQPGAGAGARPAADPARGPRAERLDLDGAARRIDRGEPLRLHLGRDQRPLRAAARRRERGRAHDARRRSRTPEKASASSSSG